MEFKSAICTSIEQSKRLLELGLKKETADMVYIPHYRNYTLHSYFKPKVLDDDILHYMLTDQSFADYIPAWSLARLFELITTKRKVMLVRFGDDLYDILIEKIRRLIVDGAFNKDYLEERR